MSTHGGTTAISSPGAVPTFAAGLRAATSAGGAYRGRHGRAAICTRATLSASDLTPIACRPLGWHAFDHAIRFRIQPSARNKHISTTMESVIHDEVDAHIKATDSEHILKDGFSLLARKHYIDDDTRSASTQASLQWDM